MPPKREDTSRTDDLEKRKREQEDRTLQTNEDKEKTERLEKAKERRNV
jgi:hypothetical protein